jgi:DNA-binding transcriptional LysR family regulator
MNLRHLRLFSRICTLGSLNQAASEMNVSQPAISVTIARLETDFGARLLERASTGSTPTAAGEVLRRRVDRMDAQLLAAIAGTWGPGAARDRAGLERCLDRISLRQLLVLRRMAATVSITEAARLAGLSASAIHRHLAELQANLGRTLVTRNADGVALNDAGRTLALRSHVALREIAQARDELRELDGRMDGRLSVACLPLVRTQLLGRAITRLLAVHPDAKVEVMDGSYEALSQQLRAGNCDMLLGALRHGDAMEGLAARVLFDDPYAVVGRADHPFATRGRGATLDELATCDWVAQQQGTPVRSAFDELFRLAARRPRISVESASLVLTRSIVLEGQHLAMLSRRHIIVEERARLLTLIPVDDAVAARLSSRPIGVTTRDNWLPSRLQQRFLDHLMQVAAEI